MVVSKSSDVSRLDWHFDLNGRGRVEDDGVIVVLRVEVIGARRRKNHLQQDLPELLSPSTRSTRSPCPYLQNIQKQNGK
jgi:hypothetical protein